MLYFKSEDGQVFAYATEVEMQEFGPPGLEAMQEADVAAHLAASRPDPAAVRRAEIVSELVAIDLASVRPLRALLASADPPASEAQRLAALDASAALLRRELASLDGDSEGVGV
jgi:hypothetical protein